MHNVSDPELGDAPLEGAAGSGGLQGGAAGDGNTGHLLAGTANLNLGTGDRDGRDGRARDGAGGLAHGDAG